MVELGAGIFISLSPLEAKETIILTGIVDFKTGQSYVSLCTENSAMFVVYTNEQENYGDIAHSLPA